MIQHINEGPPVVGKFYWVPCIDEPKFSSVTHLWRGVMLPVIGPLHTDAEILKFEPEHYHFDWRFVPERIIRWYISGTHPHCGVHPDRYLYARVTALNHTQHTKKPPIPMKRKCLRQWPKYPHAVAKWMPALEAAYQNYRLGPNMICPHKGIPLSSCPAHKGVVTCPGHGLRWDVRTGEMVPTTKGQGSLNLKP